MYAMRCVNQGGLGQTEGIPALQTTDLGVISTKLSQVAQVMHDKVTAHVRQLCQFLPPDIVDLTADSSLFQQDSVCFMARLIQACGTNAS